MNEESDKTQKGTAKPATKDRYRDFEAIGKGGMARVYSAFDTVLKRTVALKMIRRELLRSDATHAGRFRREVLSMARLQHPKVVRIFDYGVDGEIHFFTMELIDGPSVRQLMVGGPLPPRDAARIVASVAEGLAAAHALGIVHRDIKPANVLIDPTAGAKLSDFGLCTFLDKSAVTALTQTGQLVGTLPYLPPEMVQDDIHETAGDVFQIGLLLYEVLAGHLPHEGAEMEHIFDGSAYLNWKAPSSLVATVPAPLDELVMATLHLHPASRPDSAEVAATLRAWREDEDCGADLSNGLRRRIDETNQMRHAAAKRKARQPRGEGPPPGEAGSPRADADEASAEGDKGEDHALARDDELRAPCPNPLDPASPPPDTSRIRRHARAGLGRKEWLIIGLTAIAVFGLVWLFLP